MTAEKYTGYEYVNIEFLATGSINNKDIIIKNIDI